jgi:hypothetical protein
METGKTLAKEQVLSSWASTGLSAERVKKTKTKTKTTPKTEQSGPPSEPHKFSWSLWERTEEAR